jgi:hypothetical protein
MTNKIKSGGRQLGTPNKTTAELRQALANFLGNNLERMQEDLNKVSPNSRLRILIDMYRLILPQIKAVEESTNDNFKPFTIVLSTSNNEYDK